MKQLNVFTVTGILFVLCTGTLAHFVYEWSGNNSLVGLFTPVNESIWEHMKLLFFPMLTYTLFMAFKWKDKYPCILSAFFCGTLTGTLLIPVFFYAYTYLLGRDVFWLDLAVFVLSVLIAFRLSHRLTLSCRLRSYTLLLCSLICILAVCFAVFTYHPPNLEIFEDMSS